MQAIIFFGEWEGKDKNKLNNRYTNNYHKTIYLYYPSLYN